MKSGFHEASGPTHRITIDVTRHEQHASAASAPFFHTAFTHSPTSRLNLFIVLFIYTSLQIMSSSSAVTKSSGQQEVSRPALDDDSVAVESREQEASASASVCHVSVYPSFTSPLTRPKGGINLNVVGAISGALASATKVFTDTAGTQVENKSEEKHISGAGMANASGSGAAAAHAHDRQFKHIPIAE